MISVGYLGYRVNHQTEVSIIFIIILLRLPWEEVWTPDIVLYNAAGDGEQGREMRTLIQVNK